MPRQADEHEVFTNILNELTTTFSNGRETSGCYSLKKTERQLMSSVVRIATILLCAYAGLLSDALHVGWQRDGWLSDVDPFFYAACYIRAWALETHLRRVLRERFGEHWFDEREAGDFLKQLWRDGQRLPAHELLAELTGEELDFSALLEDLDLVPSA